tara:strand:+ start:176 stop:457 length:282 start_codon:yes stop_codon:yes gene_type:complete
MISYNHWYKSLTKENKIGYKIMYPDKTYKQMFKRMITRFGMILKPPLILSKKQCSNFKKYPSINPITKRNIKKDGKIYIKLKNAYKRTKKYSK